MNRNKWILAITLSAAASAMLITTAANALGQGRNGPGQDRPSFAELDTNGDGSISVAEMQAQANERFNAMDSNGDGVISAEESAAAAATKAGERAEMMFARMLEWRDSDGDGALSQSEIGGNRAEQMFSRLDTDNDGTISAEEYELAMQRGPGKGRKGHGMNGGRDNRQGG
ncbi:MAG: EF-hand domain-containing protein [Paracoccaceae bacterium]